MFAAFFRLNNVITPNTPLDVAKKQLDAWQREHALAFQADVADLIRQYDGPNGRSLERTRMAAVLAVSAAGLSGTEDVKAIGT